MRVTWVNTFRATSIDQISIAIWHNNISKPSVSPAATVNTAIVNFIHVKRNLTWFRSFQKLTWVILFISQFKWLDSSRKLRKGFCPTHVSNCFKVDHECSMGSNHAGSTFWMTTTACSPRDGCCFVQLFCFCIRFFIRIFEGLSISQL